MLINVNLCNFNTVEARHFLRVFNILARLIKNKRGWTESGKMVLTIQKLSSLHFKRCFSLWKIKSGLYLHPFQGDYLPAGRQGSAGFPMDRDRLCICLTVGIKYIRAISSAGFPMNRDRLRICLTVGIKYIWAISSAGSEHLPYKQRVGGSNPSSPTT